MSFYPREIEEQMKKFYEQLSEKDKRLYAAIEAQKLPHGGKVYIKELMQCSRQTIYAGIKDLCSEENLSEGRIRRIGGGNKKAIEKNPEIEKKFLEVVSENTAGSPQNEKVKWTCLTQEEICKKLKKLGIKVSCTVVKQLLKKHDYRRRKALKKKSGSKQKSK